MRNEGKLEIFHEKWGFHRISLTGRGFWVKMVGDRVGGGGGFLMIFLGFMRFQRKNGGFRVCWWKIGGLLWGGIFMEKVGG